MAIFAEFAKCKSDGFVSNSPKLQSLVVKLQDFITKNYYTCTDEILVGHERFKKNIDKYGKENAKFSSDAIKEYCKAL